MSNWLRGRTVVYNPMPKPPEKPRRFKVFRILWEALKRTAMAMGFALLFSIAVGAWSASQIAKKQVPSLPGEMVLLLDLTGQEESVTGPTRYLEDLGLGGTALSTADTIDAIDAATLDSRVKALALLFGKEEMDMAELQELQTAILRFRKSGKPVRAYADSYGEGGSGLGIYYLAAAADQIWMQPVGIVAVPGITAELPFGRDLLERLGVRPEFFQRKEFKTAMEHFTSNKMSEASRIQTEGLIRDLGDQLVAGIVAARPPVAASFRQLVDQGLFTDEEALRARLIDRLDYLDVFVRDLREKVGGNAKEKRPDFISTEDFFAVIHHESARQGVLTHKDNPLVARITIDGVITDGGGLSPLEASEEIVNASTISTAIMQAAEDDQVKAILVVVNSPGGTPSASETIHRAISRARSEYKKPVIVSMGGVAASGGYWVASAADKIYASGATLTGSIGVVGGKFDASGFWDKIDINWEQVAYGRNGGMWSLNNAFTVEERARFEASLDNVYAAFVQRVAVGRKLSPERIEAVARGHVWTGKQAKELGLVDALGGEDKALDDLAVALGQKDRKTLRLLDLPRTPSALEEIMTLLAEQVGVSPFLQQTFIEPLSPYLSILRGGPLVYAPLARVRH